MCVMDCLPFGENGFWVAGDVEEYEGREAEANR